MEATMVDMPDGCQIGGMGAALLVGGALVMLGAAVSLVIELYEAFEMLKGAGN